MSRPGVPGQYCDMMEVMLNGTKVCVMRRRGWVINVAVVVKNLGEAVFWSQIVQPQGQVPTSGGGEGRLGMQKQLLLESTDRRMRRRAKQGGWG